MKSMPGGMIGGALALVVIVVFVGGCSSVRVKTSIEIDRPVEQTWAVFADSDNLSQWMHATGEFRRIPWADVDPDQVGKPLLIEFHEEDAEGNRVEGGDELKIVQTITSIKPNEEFVYDFQHEWADMDFHIAFEPMGDDACSMTWDCTIHPKGLWNSIWMNIGRSSIRHRFKSHLTKLKALVEAGPK